LPIPGRLRPKHPGRACTCALAYRTSARSGDPRLDRRSLRSLRHRRQHQRRAAAEAIARFELTGSASLLVQRTHFQRSPHFRGSPGRAATNHRQGLASLWTSGNRGRTVTLKIKYADFQQIARSRSLAGIIEERTAPERISLDLLKAQFPVAKGVRLLGILLSTFTPTDPSDTEQLLLGI
jgi:nucleotidyltransferase/DNA polymerase involved in DNA repair